MSKRLQIYISDSAYELVQKTLKQATDGHSNIKINISDVIESMIETSKVNIQGLRTKHTDIRKILKELVKRKNLTAEDIINNVSELTNTSLKKEIKIKQKQERDQTDENSV